jgi:hypothetical protein
MKNVKSKDKENKYCTRLIDVNGSDSNIDIDDQVTDNSNESANESHKNVFKCQNCLVSEC